MSNYNEAYFRQHGYFYEDGVLHTPSGYEIEPYDAIEEINTTPEEYAQHKAEAAAQEAAGEAVYQAAQIYTHFRGDWDDMRTGAVWVKPFPFDESAAKVLLSAETTNVEDHHFVAKAYEVIINGVVCYVQRESRQPHHLEYTYFSRDPETAGLTRAGREDIPDFFDTNVDLS